MGWRLRENLKVACTEVVREWPLLAVDYARDGKVIGIESVGWDDVKISVMLKAAKIRPTAQFKQSIRLIRPELTQAVA